MPVSLTLTEVFKMTKWQVIYSVKGTLSRLLPMYMKRKLIFNYYLPLNILHIEQFI